jgi:ribosomal protein S27E
VSDYPTKQTTAEQAAAGMSISRTDGSFYRLTCRDCGATFLSPLCEASCPACQRAMLARLGDRPA